MKVRTAAPGPASGIISGVPGRGGAVAAPLVAVAQTTSFLSDDVNDRVAQTPTTPVTGTPPLSMAAWIKPGAIGPSALWSFGLCDSGIGGGDDLRRFVVQYNTVPSPYRARVVVQGAAGLSILWEYTAPIKSVWSHQLVVWDSTTSVRFFINGVEKVASVKTSSGAVTVGDTWDTFRTPVFFSWGGHNCSGMAYWDVDQSANAAELAVIGADYRTATGNANLKSWLTMGNMAGDSTLIDGGEQIQDATGGPAAIPVGTVAGSLVADYQA